jgi:hypothetical protein
MKKDLGAEVGGFDAQSAVGVALRVLRIGIVNEDKVGRTGDHPGLENLTEEFLLVGIPRNHRLYPLVTDSESNVRINELARITFTMIFSPKEFWYIGV